MTINVFGLSRLPPSARKRPLIAKACRAALKSPKQGELNVVFLDRKRMRVLNKRFLRRSHDTDVIAFNYEGEEAFGDVYISAFQARRQARELAHPVLTEVLTLAVHGTLHLLGYDDATPRQKQKMFRRQDEVLALLRRA